MSPASEDEDQVDVKETGSKSEDGAPTDATGKHPTKRRTKTGCLTCRKRRIKCGEEKPVCKNCIKSKRECAGYAQPLVYKQQTHGPATSVQDSGEHNLPLGEHGAPPGGLLNLRWQSEPQYLGPQQGFDSTVPTPYYQLPFSASYHAVSLPPQENRPYGGVPHSESYLGWQDGPQSSQQAHPGMFDSTSRAMSGFAAPNEQNLPGSSTSFPLDPRLAGSSIYSHSYTISPQNAIPPSALPVQSYNLSHEHSNFVQFHQRSASLSQPYNTSPIHIDENAATQYRTHTVLQRPTFATHPSFAPPAGPHPEEAPNEETFEDPDDPFDVEMEEGDVSFQDAANNLTEILDRSGQRSWQASRTYVPRRAQFQPLATFRPAFTQSPLRDERNERIFCHFVEITSHCVSIFERHHFSPMAAPARTLWNFTIPALALSHAALAHSILALGALHLAKLNDTSDATAIKHFTYSVRRVGKLLGLPKRRYEIATLATVLVLGFYEVLSGDHSRWNLHLSGATRLVLEHDYATLTRTARRMRSGAKARINQWTAQFALTEENYARVAAIPLALLDDIDWEVDSALVSRLTGIRVDYDHQFQPNFPSGATLLDLSEKDIEDFKAKMDLRWWYCKQDIFQSMVSGDRLLMPFENWIYCPPRGQIGRSGNPYATLDHLLFVMARLTDFGGKDRGRKQRAVSAQGGQWRPPKWLFGPPGQAGPPNDDRKGNVGSSSKQPSSLEPDNPGPSTRPLSQGAGGSKSSAAPSANEGRVRQSKPGVQGPPPSAGPPMLGMMPPPAEPPQLHSAFQSMDASIKDPAFGDQRSRKESTPPRNLEDDTARASAEYKEIAKGFDLFVEALGPDFEPLRHTGTPIATPFGPALLYRNAAVACIWAFYYIGRILLHRVHPDMPPAAMVSAGVTAHLTREYAQNVGKICAGLYASPQYGQNGALDPSFAGALMETTFILLFAGVQYTDAGQRGWTISKLKDVERRCGWHTSGAIAAACEIAWEKMGQAGKGPPYERTIDVNNKDPRVSGAARKADEASPRSGQVSDAAAEHESEFVNHDRNLIDRSGSTRVHWALGLLSVEEDIKKMALEDE